MSTSVRVPSCSLVGTTKLTRCRGATPIPANRNFKPSKGFNSHHTLRRAANNCVVQPAPSDLTPPAGQYKGLIDGKYTISVSDTGSGLSSILVTTVINANVTVPEIVGQTTPLN